VLWLVFQVQRRTAFGGKMEECAMTTSRGDSLCISEWPEKCFWLFPNWVEYICVVLMPLALTARYLCTTCITAALLITAVEHLLLTIKFYPSACRQMGRGFWRAFGFLYTLFVACGAGMVLSFQEVTRVAAHMYRGHWHCVCRRVDWYDGQDSRVKLDAQLGSFLRVILYVFLTCIYLLQ